MLTFIHLSDIHFSAKDNASQLDLNQHIRRALLDDLTSKPAGVTGYDALLITGDIAYSGKKEEYERAKIWLSEVFQRTGLSMNATYVVPGNHDVDRSHVQPNFPLWASHEEIRRNSTPVHWRATIETQLERDPSQLLLAPLHTYNDFAQGCGCQTTAKNLAWSLDFPKALERGTLLRIRGLNSALISDASDAPAKLLVSEFQTATLCAVPGVINLILCHHPPDWLMDKAEVRVALRKFAPIALFGHEHSARVHPDEKQIQLFAGAVQPPRTEPGWLPTYHIFQLAVDGPKESPQLVIKVHTREFENYAFRPWRFEDGETVLERCIAIPAWEITRKTEEKTLAQTAETGISYQGTMPTNENKIESAATNNAHRELLVYFFQLRTPNRYEAAFTANLLRDGDDALDPQVMWAEVFRRAAEENKLADLWTAVSAHIAEMKQKPNPFIKEPNA